MAALYNNPESILETILKKQNPTIMMWNRLEGRPRTHNFDKALKAEVRDALWMLCKQWQMGEFKGEDAGSPVFSKIKISTSEISDFSLGNNPLKKLDNSIPLETIIEQKAIPFERNNQKISLDIRLQLGKLWNKLLKSKSLESYHNTYLDAFGFTIPVKDRNSDYIYAHKEEFQQWVAVKGRCIDGYELVKNIIDGNAASTGITLTDALHKAILDELGTKLLAYYIRNYHQPAQPEDNGWLPDRLEYKASCVANTTSEKSTLNANEYYQGHLDWFAFDFETAEGDGSSVTNTIKDTFIPTHVEFEGMPDRRWWKFEDYKTSFGDITPSTTDVSKLLLIEFGLIYANDWFLLPFTIPIGTIAEVQGLSVSTNFDDVFWIEATEKGSGSLNDWSMFRQKSADLNKKVFLCPAAMKVQEGAPLEQVGLVRDEMANMVWALEKVVPLSIGKGFHGGEFALQTRQYHQGFIDTTNIPDVPYAANIYYNAMSDVPENWIPFVPVHTTHKRKVQIQRASMLRIINGDKLKPEKIKPVTSLLREGLEAQPIPQPYIIHEEEVLRTGTNITQRFQRTRWLNGQVFVWLGTNKKTGKGEASSGLAFDQLKNAKPQNNE